jgi:hypothetical protein
MVSEAIRPLPEPGTVEAFVVHWLYRIALSPLGHKPDARGAAGRYIVWVEACERAAYPMCKVAS